MNSRGRAADRHIPVLRDRILDLLAPALTEPGSVYVDAHPGHGRARARPSSSAARSARLVGHRPRPGGARARGGAPRAVCRAASPSCTRSTTSSPTCAGTTSACREVARRPVRPRRLLAAARRGRPRVRLQPGRAARTCGWTRAAASPRPTSSTPTRPAELERILREYGEERFARKIAGGHRPGARRGAVHDLGPPGRAAQEGRPGRLAEERRPPGQAHLPGAAHRGQRRAVGLGRGPAGRHRRRSPVGGRVAVLSYHSLEDRITKRVFAAGAAQQHARGPPRRAARSTRHTCVCSRAGPRSPARRSRPPTPDLPRPACGPRERTRSTKGQHR